MRRYDHVSFSYQQAKNARAQTNKNRPSRRQIIRILLSEKSDLRCFPAFRERLRALKASSFLDGLVESACSLCHEAHC
ncbi:hypothetical protein GLE_0052 [Lysobacter enzymogenes]|uniref:Uncharacterized protein n=1 Tax=Lysobacter enzymogenes TaxID=69 RepID=A0A0S2DA86_LYSEN|nr:hypothetical protein GLE_0052 [Lysobacter enzymogenes]